MNSKQLLHNIYNNFRAKTGYGIVIGIEQEFYLSGTVDNLSSSIAAFPCFSEPEKEKGEGQFEVQIRPCDSPVIIADMVMLLRGLIKNTALFTAMPYLDQPGSGMHVNINLVDETGNNVFSNAESKVLQSAIAGLLELMPASVKYFAPYEAAYVRYTGGMESPSTVSWGGDNRTVALRIPSVPLTPYARRIEHRVPCADSDPYIVIAAIIAAIEFGIVNSLENKHPKIFGNAFLPQYGLPGLPRNLAEAVQVRHEYLVPLSGFRDSA